MKQIIYYTASWCQPCKILGPIMESLNGQINYLKVDVDSNPDLVIQHKVRSVPTLILVENGIEKNRLSGVQQAHTILNFYNG